MCLQASSLARDFLHPHQGHAGALHLVPDLGGTPQLAEDQAAYGVEVLALETRTNNVVDLADADTPVCYVGSVFEPLYVRLLLVELVSDLAHDLLDYVLHCYYPLEGAPLVYYHRHLDPLPLE